MSNSLDQDQDRHSVNFCLDMGPNCLQRLLAEDKWKEIRVVSPLMDLGPIFN